MESFVKSTAITKVAGMLASYEPARTYPPRGSPSRIWTAPPLTAAMSRMESALKNPVASTEAPPGTATLREASKDPLPLARRIVTLASFGLLFAMSSAPSPLKSPAARALPYSPVR
jgi:hypothetical protein